MGGDFSDLIAQAEGRIANNSREKDAIMCNIGDLEREIAASTRYLGQKETERATVMFTRPRTAALDADLERLEYDVSTLKESLKMLEFSKTACLSKMRELDAILAGDRRVIEMCGQGGSVG